MLSPKESVLASAGRYSIRCRRIPRGCEIPTYCAASLRPDDVIAPRLPSGSSDETPVDKSPSSLLVVAQSAFSRLLWYYDESRYRGLVVATESTWGCETAATDDSTRCVLVVGLSRNGWPRGGAAELIYPTLAVALLSTCIGLLSTCIWLLSACIGLLSTGIGPR